MGMAFLLSLPVCWLPCMLQPVPCVCVSEWMFETWGEKINLKKRKQGSKQPASPFWFFHCLLQSVGSLCVSLHERAFSTRCLNHLVSGCFMLVILIAGFSFSNVISVCSWCILWLLPWFLKTRQWVSIMSLIKNVGLMVVSHTQQGCAGLQQTRSRYSKQGCEDRMVRLEEVFGSSICTVG